MWMLKDYIFSESVEMRLLSNENHNSFTDCDFCIIRDLNTISELVEWVIKNQAEINFSFCAGEMCFTIDPCVCKEQAIMQKCLELINAVFTYGDKIHFLFKSPYEKKEEYIC